MRILSAHPSPDLYGADLMMLRSVEALVQRGHQVSVAVPESGPLVRRLRSAGATVLIEPFPVVRRSLRSPAALVATAARSPATVRRLRRLVTTHDADLVYVNTITLPHWLAAGRLARRPVVCHVREAEDTATRAVATALVAPLVLATEVIANSAHTARFLARHLGGTAPRITVVHNGMVFEPAPPPAPASPGTRLAVVGRLNPKKGQDVAIDAVRLLHDEGREVELDIVGSTFPGYEWVEEGLREQVHRLELDGAIRFVGYREAAGAMADADVVLVPSRSETFGNVAVEAMAAARPLVASAVGGLREIVRDGETGRLVPADDPRALATAVASLLDDPVGTAELARAGFDDARTRFSAERYAEQLARRLERAGSGSNGGSTQVLAVLTGSGAVGGVETSVSHLAVELGRVGVELEAAVLGPPESASAAADHLAGHLPTVRPHGPVGAWRAVRRAQVVHVHSPTCLRWPALLILGARAARRPVVLTLHLPGYPPPRPTSAGRARAKPRFVLRGALLQLLQVDVRAPSAEAAALARRRFRPARVTVAELRNGVPDRPWTAIDPAPGPLRAAFVGRLDRHKRPEVFVEAIGLAHRRGVAIDAVMAGEGPERPALEALAAGFGAPVRLLGAVGDPTVVMAGCDVLVVPSVTEGGAPLVVQEAAACGRPSVVQPSLEGMAAWAEAFVAVASGRGATDFADALEALAGDRVHLARMGRAARLRYESGFTASAAAARLKAVYDTVATRPRP